MRQHWEFGAPPRIVFGRGAVRQLERIVKSQGATEVVIVSDANVLDIAAVSEQVGRIGASVRCHVFRGGEPEPAFSVVRTAYEEVMGRLRSPDMVIAIGGGSNTDVAKGLSVLLAHGGDIGTYVGENNVPGPTVPLVSVSTTAGTGSEVSGVAVLTDTERGTKVGISSSELRAHVAVYDPELTISCPARVTAHAGIDALTHAIEAYMAVVFSDLQVPDDAIITYQGKNPYSDALALRAIHLIASSLRNAVLDGQDVESREAVHLGSLLAGLAFSNAGLGAVHALQLPLGTLTKSTHGLGNGILLPYVMDFNRPERTHELRVIGRALGEDVDGLTDSQATEASIAAVVRLRRDIQIPATLGALGFSEDDIPGVAQTVMKTQGRLLRTNPRSVDHEGVQSILSNALHGRFSFD